MAESENLAILIDVIDNFSKELDLLLFKLGQVDRAAGVVDPIRVDVEVDGAWKLDHLLFKLGQLEAADMSGFGDVVVGDKSVTRRGGGGGISSRAMTQAVREGFGEAFENIGNVSASAGAAADATDAMADSMDGAEDSVDIFDLRMSDLHNALAKLVPLIFVVIGALPALIGGLVALGAAAVSAAAALAALGGLGAIGFAAATAGRDNMLEGLQEVASEVADDFLDAFLPLAQRLVPLFRDMMDGLDMLFQNIANRGDVLLQLQEQARAFGGFLLDWIPGALEAMGRMAAAFDGFFSLIADGMRDADVLEGLTRFFAQAQPEFTKFFALLMPMIPALGNLSIGFLQVTNAVMTLIAPLAWVAEQFPRLTAMLGTFIAALLATMTAVALFNAATALSATVALPGFLGSIEVAAFRLITSYVPAMGYATASTLAFASALAVAATILTGGLALIGVLGSQFIGLGSDIDEATESLKAFDSVAGGMSDTNPFAHPQLEHGSVNRAPRSGGGDVNVTIEGDADKDATRRQVHNAQYRQERSRRRL